MSSRTASFPSSTDERSLKSVPLLAKGVRHPSTMATLRPFPFIRSSLRRWLSAEDVECSGEHGSKQGNGKPRLTQSPGGVEEEWHAPLCPCASDKMQRY